MNKRTKIMLISAIILTILLVTKSLWFDPVGVQEGDEEKYRQFALEVAPIKSPSILDRTRLLTYRVIVIAQVEKEGYTKIMYRDKEDDELWIAETIEGQYEAKVRRYILGIIPTKDIKIEGGIL